MPPSFPLPLPLPPPAALSPTVLPAGLTETQGTSLHVAISSPLPAPSLPAPTMASARLHPLPAPPPSPVLRGMMVPRLEALAHPAAKLLLEYAYSGCPVDCGPPWTLSMLQAAIAKGAHPSACLPAAAQCCRTETLAKVEAGFARLIPWASISASFPATLKISPIAAVPHKSRLYRMILDLSFQVRLLTGERVPSVNDSSNKSLAFHASMRQLGLVIPRIIWTLATAPSSTPFSFVKFDIKDGYWRMAVSDRDAWNFAYVLPPLQPNDPVMLVIPAALQMGWCESPPFFCSASETARDIADMLARNNLPLPPHPLETLTLATPVVPDSPAEDHPLSPNPINYLFEVYIDDFIGIAQTTDPHALRHLSRALLRGIHSVFPPPGVAGFTGDEPISLKKLLNGEGVWDTRKEILGWVFDGNTRCIELPLDKCTKIQHELRHLRTSRRIKFKDLQKLRGKLQHASIAMPVGKPLLGPIDAALCAATAAHHPWIYRKPNDPLDCALRDWTALLRMLGARPTNVLELVPAPPDYIGYCDASKLGAGGVWFSGARHIAPTVWRFAWPAWVRDTFLSAENPTGTITNSDLEMAGLLLHWCALEHLAPLKHCHVAIYCDNTPTVSWTRRLNSTKSRIAARLVRALALRMRDLHTSPLAALSIAGIDNTMADFSSRTFHRRTKENPVFLIDDFAFLTSFATAFPIPAQAVCWRILRLNTKLTSAILSELRMQPSTLESWLRLSARGTAVGSFGPGSPPTFLIWTRISSTSLQPTASTPLSVSLSGSGTALSPTAEQFGLNPYKSRYVPSARPSNWMANPIPPTNRPGASTAGYNDNSKPTDAMTLPLHPKLPSP